MSLNIAVINYGIGNVKSILNIFEKAGVTPSLLNQKELILAADGVVLPGVGAFSQGMENLHKYSLVKTLKEYAKLNKPLLGICLGMEMLLNESEEFGATQGIGLIPGKVIKLPTKNTQYKKLPHVSWNEITPKNINWENTILGNIEFNSDMYFTHSYIAVPEDESHILSTTIYSDYEFCSSIKKGNIYGCQFHPEKSAERGLKIIDNFINLCSENKSG